MSEFSLLTFCLTEWKELWLEIWARKKKRSAKESRNLITLENYPLPYPSAEWRRRKRNSEELLRAAGEIRRCFRRLKPRSFLVSSPKEIQVCWFGRKQTYYRTCIRSRLFKIIASGGSQKVYFLDSYFRQTNKVKKKLNEKTSNISRDLFWLLLHFLSRMFSVVVQLLKAIGEPPETYI